METTGRFDLPLIMPSQAQKHITHNEALTLLDGLLHVSIKSFGADAPPVGAAIDEAHVVGVAANGAWFGHEGDLAFNTDAGWRFVAPVQGLIALDLTAARMMIHDQAIWKPLSDVIPISTLPALGINAAADATNKFALRSNAALLTALGAADGGTGDMRLAVNKEAASDTGSLVFQTGWSGRAEFGLSGDDDFRIKVSPDGSVWNESLRIDRASGIVTLAANSVGNAGLADMASATIKGRTSVGAGDPEDLTGAQAAALLPAFTASAKGLAPASGGGAATWLRADGAWTVPGPGDGTASGPGRFYAFNDFTTSATQHDFVAGLSGTGAAFAAVAFGEANAIGAVRGTLGAVAANRVSLTSSSTNLFVPGQGAARFAGRFRLASLSSAAENWTFRVGFVDTLSSECVDGVYFRYSDNFNAGRFQAVTRNNSVETAVDTGILPALATTYKFEIDVNADASIAAFRINGAPVASITATIPKTVGRETGYGVTAIRGAGTANLAAFDVDYMQVDIAVATAR